MATCRNPLLHATAVVTPLCLCTVLAHAGQVHDKAVTLHDVVSHTLATGGGIALLEMDAKPEQPHAFAVAGQGAKKCPPYAYFRWHARFVEWLAPPKGGPSLAPGVGLSVVPANAPELVALERVACLEGGSKSPVFERFGEGVEPKGGQRAIAFLRHDASYGWVQTVAGAWLGPDRANHFRAKFGAGDHAGHGSPGHDHAFKDAAAWTKKFDDPARDAWQKPEVVIAVLGLQPTATVADLGAGTGYFAVRLAAAVPQGKVYAADVEPEMTDHLRKRAAQQKLRNLVAVLCKRDDANLPGAVDAVLVVDTLHHLGDRVGYLGRLRRYLKPGARVAVVDYKLGDIPHGPPLAMRVAPDTVVAEFERAGLHLVRREEAQLAYQYLLVFAAPR